MNKLTSLILAGALMLSCTACGTQPVAEAIGATDGTLSGKVTTGGSTSMEKVIGALSEAFMVANPDVTVTYDPTGSGAGIAGVTEQTLDVGLSSRNLKDNETSLSETVIALDGIVLIVNPKNSVRDLTLEQIAEIATGKIKNWSEVGGTSGEIVFYGREAGSGTRDGFESVVKVADQCAYTEELTATGAIVGKVATNQNGIGYVSLASVQDSVATLCVDGVSPSIESVQNGSYALQRPFLFVTNDKAAQTAAVQAFLAFSQSAQAQRILMDAGVIPLQ